VIACELLAEDGGLAHRSIGAYDGGKQLEAGLIHEHYRPTLRERPLSEKAPRVNASAVCMLTSDVPRADRVRLHTVLA
jgi:hypothetical protein